jgi:hypothetical protein
MTDANPLQLERAEFDQPPASACASCGQPLQAAYYLVNDAVVCATCHDRLRAAAAARPGVQGLVKAAIAGAVAAAAGALLYYGVLRLTGYEFGLIAIVVGFAVGKAVNWGSGGVGGAAYQAIAVPLTYLSIVGGYIPAIYDAMSEANLPDMAQIPFTEVATLAIKMPFLGEASSNLIGWVIIAIGLYEAWKFTKPTPFQATGPHAIAPRMSTSAT